MKKCPKCTIMMSHGSSVCYHCAMPVVLTFLNPFQAKTATAILKEIHEAALREAQKKEQEAALRESQKKELEKIPPEEKKAEAIEEKKTEISPEEKKAEAIEGKKTEHLLEKAKKKHRKTGAMPQMFADDSYMELPKESSNKPSEVRVQISKSLNETQYLELPADSSSELLFAIKDDSLGDQTLEKKEENVAETIQKNIEAIKPVERSAPEWHADESMSKAEIEKNNKNEEQQEKPLIEKEVTPPEKENSDAVKEQAQSPIEKEKNSVIIEKIKQYPPEWEWMVFPDNETGSRKSYKVVGMTEKSHPNVVFVAEKKIPLETFLEKLSEDDKEEMKNFLKKQKVLDCVRKLRKQFNEISLFDGIHLTKLFCKKNKIKFSKKNPMLIEHLPQQRKQVLKVLHSGKTLDAIYLLRSLTKQTLQESREQIEYLCEKERIAYNISRWKYKARDIIHQYQPKSGLGWVIFFMVILGILAFLFWIK